MSLLSQDINLQISDNIEYILSLSISFYLYLKIDFWINIIDHSEQIIILFLRRQMLGKRATKILSCILILFCTLSTCSLNPLCDVCHDFIGLIHKQTPKKPALFILQKIAVQYCVQKHLQTKKVCVGAIKEMTQFILEGLWNHYTNPHLICQKIRFCSNEFQKRDLTKDIQKIMAGKIPKEWQKPTMRKSLKIMHISDLHPDLFYAAGSPVDCNQPVCCRSNVTSKQNSTRKAGYWGSIGSCDVPFQTLDLLMKQINKTNPDAIFWSGDNTPHDIWQQSQSYNLNFTTIIAQKLRKATNAIVIPSMGNHQSWPVNVYDYKSDRESVLNAGLAQAWRYWLDQKALKMQRQKGYFSMVYPTLNNVKVLSINTQSGNHENFLLLQDPSDPGEMLQWIQEQLAASEKINQMVYITGHIPPRSILNDWSMRFNALVDRYSFIIRGQFYGHMHSDHISFYPEIKSISNFNDAPLTNYYLAAPSLTTASDRVPQYRVMHVDFDSLQVTDFDQFRLDLRKYQRQDQNAQFQILYKFKQAYKVNDMTVRGGITELRNKLRDDPSIQKLYSYHQCGGVCQGKSGREVYCDSTTAPQLHAGCTEGSYKKSAFEKFAGPWLEFKHKDE